jgi:flagellin
MALTVRTNIAAITSSGALNKTTKKLQKSLLRVSSGLRINSAADDAAGMGVANALETTSISLRQAMRNTNDGVSIIQTAETAADEITNILQRVRELAVQSASETLSDQERSYIGDEYDELLSEIDRIAASTQFNGVDLTNSTTDLAVQVGTTSSTMISQISIHLGDLTASTGLGLNAGTVSLTSSTQARLSLDVIDTALTSVNSLRASFGAVQNRLDNTLANAQTYYEALASAESRIRDLDFADETAELSKLQILQQSGVAALAQAKNINQSVINLLQ